MTQDYYNNYQGSQNSYDGYDDQYDGDNPRSYQSQNKKDDTNSNIKPTPVAKKVIRTIFYTILMLTSLILVAIYIYLMLKVAGKAGSIKENITKHIPLIAKISLYTFLGSVIFLIFTARQGIVIPIISLVFFLAMVFVILFIYPLTNGLYQLFALTGDGLYFGEYYGFKEIVKVSLKTILKGIGETPTIENIKFIPLIANAVMFVSSIILTVYLATRRPRTAASSILEVALIFLNILFFYNVVIDIIVLTKKVPKLLNKDTFKWITLSMHGLKGFSFILFVFGSLFGIFATKKD